MGILRQLALRAETLWRKPVASKRSRLDEALAGIRQSLKDDPANIELANRSWKTLAEGDYRSGR